MLKQRIITALILAPLVLAGIIYLPVLPFAFLVAFVMLLAAWEWADLSSLSPSSRNIFIAVIGAALIVCYLLSPGVQMGVLSIAVIMWCLIIWWVITFPESQTYWGASSRRTFLGVVIITSAWLSLVLLKQQPLGAEKIILLLFMVWGADIGAYFAGRAWGNRKLAPNVSPGKTRAGAYGGIIAAVIVALTCSYLFGLFVEYSFSEWLLFAVLGLLIAIVSIFGDLAESMVKRFRGVKDSGQLLPGHGGMMDRIDSLVATLPVYTLFFFFTGQV